MHERAKEALSKHPTTVSCLKRAGVDCTCELTINFLKLRSNCIKVSSLK